MEEDAKTLADYWELVARRKWYLILPCVMIGFAALVVALKLPSVYRSTATILIQDQQVARHMVPGTAADFADERIQLIERLILTRERILGLIDKYRLYPEPKQWANPAGQLQQFMEDTEITLVSSGGRRDGESGNAAFTIAFRNPQPALAYAITDELVTLFLQENTRLGTQRAARTTEFLNEEAEKLRRDLQAAESRIAEFKSRYGQSLPELLSLNLSVIDRAVGEVQQTDNDIKLLKDRISLLTAELARLDREPPPIQEKTPQGKAGQLRNLRAEYLRLSSRYNPNHPDVQRLLRQIQALDPSFTGEAPAPDLRSELARTRQALSAAERKYAGTHPDVVALREQVAKLESEATTLPPVVEESRAAWSGDPVYINLNTQLKSSTTELENQVQRRRALMTRLEELRGHVNRTPEVERHYLDLTRERENILKKYSELKDKMLEAKLTQTLEEEQKGQTFTVVDPPVIPDKPEGRNRKKIVIMGFGLGFLLGLAAAFLAESLDGSVRGYRSLQRMTGMSSIVVIPYIENPRDIDLKRRKQHWAWAGAGVGLVLAVLTIHFVAMPLDRLWFMLLRQLEIL